MSIYNQGKTGNSCPYIKKCDKPYAEKDKGGCLDNFSFGGMYGCRRYMNFEGQKDSLDFTFEGQRDSSNLTKHLNTQILKN